MDIFKKDEELEVEQEGKTNKAQGKGKVVNPVTGNYDFIMDDGTVISNVGRPDEDK